MADIPVPTTMTLGEALCTLAERALAANDDAVTVWSYLNKVGMFAAKTGGRPANYVGGSTLTLGDLLCGCCWTVEADDVSLYVVELTDDRISYRPFSDDEFDLDEELVHPKFN